MALIRDSQAYFQICSAEQSLLKTLSDAVAMSKKNDNQLRIVTLDGQMINAGGSMTGGSAAKNAGILSRANELKTLSAKAQALEAETQECNARLTEATRELNSARYELQTANSSLKRLLRSSASATAKSRRPSSCLGKQKNPLTLTRRRRHYLFFAARKS